MGTVSRYRVSAKIQQLLNTLKKPKRRPLNEFYEDDDIELEMAARYRESMFLFYTVLPNV